MLKQICCPEANVNARRIDSMASVDGNAPTALIELRPYQTEVIAKIAATIDAGKRRILLVAPTGSGKTVIASAIIEAAAARGGRVLFLAHRRELIQQAHTKLFEYDIDAGIIQAGFPSRPDEHVQIASIQTLWTRAMLVGPEGNAA